MSDVKRAYKNQNMKITDDIIHNYYTFIYDNISIWILFQS
jgi:hypothetical protein